MQNGQLEMGNEEQLLAFSTTDRPEGGLAGLRSRLSELA